MAAERRKCFSILGLQDGASEDEIRKSYKKLALQYHPDKNESDAAKGKFQEIGYAYKFLTDGPDAFETANPHDVREDFFRHLFEEMFFARFRGPFGGFPFFCDDSGGDDCDMYSECYCGSCHTKGKKSRGGRHTYENTYSQAPRSAQTFQEPSKKQQRKREKRQRQRERQKEQKEEEKHGKQKEEKKRGTRNTADVHAEPKTEAATSKPVHKDDSCHISANKNDTGGSRPDAPFPVRNLNQQQQKLTKKQKKKNECEQWKREKEMEEIAAKLTKKHERDVEKQREKEEHAAQKKEDEIENDLDFHHFFENGKKSRKARQREKRRQENCDTPEPVKPGKPLEHITLSNNSNAPSNSGTSISSADTVKGSGRRSSKPGVRNDETGNSKSGSGFGRNGKKVKSAIVNSGISDDTKSRYTELEDGSERKFVEDWSTVYDSDKEEEEVDHVIYAQHENVLQNSSPDNFGYGYDNSYYPQRDSYGPRGFPAPQREFTPRTRRPPGFQPLMRGPPPFGNGNMYPQPYFTGGFPDPPFHFNKVGNPIPNYGPPMGMPSSGSGFGSRNHFDSCRPRDDFCHGGGPHMPDNRKNNTRNVFNKPKHVNPKMSSNRRLSSMQSVNTADLSVEDQSEVETRETTLPVPDSRVPSPEYHSRPPENQLNMTNRFAKNMFSNVQNNQAGSDGSLDSLDDFVLYETGPVSTDNQKLRESGPEHPYGRNSPYPTVDMGLDEFLSKDNLGIPKGLFNDSIKNYYK